MGYFSILCAYDDLKLNHEAFKSGYCKYNYNNKVIVGKYVGSSIENTQVCVRSLFHYLNACQNQNV